MGDGLAIIKCRECRKEVSDQAKQCPHCGIGTPSFYRYLNARLAATENGDSANLNAQPISNSTPKGLPDKIRRVAYWAATAIILIIVISKGPDVVRALAEPACQIISVKGDHDVFLTNGEADAGVRVTALVKKLKRDGDVTVSVTVSASDGEWQKSTTGTMKMNEQRNAVLQFPETTITSDNIRYNAICR